MKAPIILEGEAFPWDKPNPAGKVVDDDGEVNWRAASFADPGVMKCPKCAEYLWREGVRVRCPTCNNEFEVKSV